MTYQEFRKALDNILRAKDPKALRQFLVSQGQWGEDAHLDAEHAMWLMIAGSPALQELHGEAQAWLTNHGYRSEADLLRTQEKPDLKQQKRKHNPSQIKKGPPTR